MVIIVILLGLLFLTNAITLIMFYTKSKVEITKELIISTLADVKHIEETRFHIEETRFSQFIHRNILQAGIHALLINKGYRVPFSEVVALYKELENENEVLYELTKKYTNQELDNKIKELLSKSENQIKDANIR